MHAFIQSIETLVVALAAAAFAHFGVTLKDCPSPKAAPAASRAWTPASGALRQTPPCPLARDVRRV